MYSQEWTMENSQANQFASETWTNSWIPHGNIPLKNRTKTKEDLSQATKDPMTLLSEKMYQINLHNTTAPPSHNTNYEYINVSDPVAKNSWKMDHHHAPQSNSLFSNPMGANPSRKSGEFVGTDLTVPNGSPGIEEELLQQNLYKTELCRSWRDSGICRYGLKCQFAHGEHELRLLMRHPRYKTEPCKTYFARGECPYGNRCRFLHPSDSSLAANRPQPKTSNVVWSNSWNPVSQHPSSASSAPPHPSEIDRANWGRLSIFASIASTDEESN